jgi:hypothetical protein
VFAPAKTTETNQWQKFFSCCRYISVVANIHTNIRGCIQKFPDWVDNEINNNNNKHSLRSNTKGYGGKIVIQLHLVAESCTICSSRSRRPVRKLLDTPSYLDIQKWFSLCFIKYSPQRKMLELKVVDLNEVYILTTTFGAYNQYHIHRIPLSNFRN